MLLEKICFYGVVIYMIVLNILILEENDEDSEKIVFFIIQDMKNIYVYKV